VCRPKHVEWTKQRNKIHCIQLHLLVISIEYYDGRNSEYKIATQILSPKTILPCYLDPNSDINFEVLKSQLHINCL